MFFGSWQRKTRDGLSRVFFSYLERERVVARSRRILGRRCFLFFLGLVNAHGFVEYDRLFVHFQSLYHDCLVRCNRTNIFAGPAAYTYVFVDIGYV